MPKKKKKISHFWFWLALASMLTAVPNATIIRSSVAEQDPFLFNALRFGVGMIVCLPFLLLGLRKFTHQNIKAATLAGLFLAVAVTANVFAMKLSAASYVLIIALVTPIIMVVLSARMVGEKITARAVAGITLAAIGAMTIILLPIAIHQGANFVFYPEATFFALLGSVAVPLSIIYSRRANEEGLPFMPLMGYTGLFAIVVNLACFWLFAETKEVSLTVYNPWMIIYSGIVVALFVRMLNILCYEKVGGATIGALAYLEMLLAILLPIFVLGETLSLPMIVGGILILLGVYVIEHHKTRHHKHFHSHFNR